MHLQGIFVECVSYIYAVMITARCGAVSTHTLQIEVSLAEKPFRCIFLGLHSLIDAIFALQVGIGGNGDTIECC